MPRSVADARQFTCNPTIRPPLRPPPDLNELERAEFVGIVAGTPVGHFVPADAVMIAHLATHIVLERIALGELKAAGYVADGKPSPWLAVLQHASREVRATSRALGINPTSRLPAKHQQSNEPPMSVYQQMRLAREQQHKDDAATN